MRVWRLLTEGNLAAHGNSISGKSHHLGMVKVPTQLCRIDRGGGNSGLDSCPGDPLVTRVDIGISVCRYVMLARAVYVYTCKGTTVYRRTYMVMQ